MSVLTLTSTIHQRALVAEDRFHELCQRHAVTFLRVALGAIFILFGALKFFPNLSPAQAVAEMTTEKLTLGLVPAQSLLYFVAFVEVTVGAMIITNKGMRYALWLLAFEMFAILSPLVLLTGQLFSGPHHLPSLLGQYILKDFVLLGSVLVLFAMQRGVITVPATTEAKETEGEADIAPARTLSATRSSKIVAPTGAHRTSLVATSSTAAVRDRSGGLGQHGRSRYRVVR